MATPSKKPLNKLVPSLVIVLLGVAGVLIGRFLFAPSPPPPPPEPPPVMREVQLYFATVAGDGLVAETGRIEDCQVIEDCLRRSLEALIAGPRGRWCRCCRRARGCRRWPSTAPRPGSASAANWSPAIPGGA